MCARVWDARDLSIAIGRAQQKQLGLGSVM